MLAVLNSNVPRFQLDTVMSSARGIVNTVYGAVRCLSPSFYVTALAQIFKINALKTSMYLISFHIIVKLGVSNQHCAL